MRAILRYAVLFAGIVLMINGCNGLVSSQFGTHSLRQLPLSTIEREGLGEADYVSITDAKVGEAFVVTLPGSFLAPGTTQMPLLTAEQSAALARGERVSPSIFVYTTYTASTSAQAAAEKLRSATSVTGLISEPPGQYDTRAEWAEQGIALPDQARYLHLNEAPLAWYWNLAFFLGGLLVAVVPEALTFHQSRPADPT